MDQGWRGGRRAHLSKQPERPRGNEYFHRYRASRSFSLPLHLFGWKVLNVSRRHALKAGHSCLLASVAPSLPRPPFAPSCRVCLPVRPGATLLTPAEKMNSLRGKVLEGTSERFSLAGIPQTAQPITGESAQTGRELSARALRSASLQLGLIGRRRRLASAGAHGATWK